MPRSSNAVRPRTRRKECRPAELLAAALEEFGERGFAAARLEDIARRAGVSKATVYLYFRSKDALFEAVVRETLGSLMARSRTVLREFDGSTAELLAGVLRMWWSGVVCTRASTLSKLMIAEAANFPALARCFYEQFIEPGRWLLRRILERGISRGEFRPIDVDCYVQLIVGPLIYVQCLQHSFARVLPGLPVEGDAFLAAFTEHVLTSLAASPHPPTQTRGRFGRDGAEGWRREIE